MDWLFESIGNSVRGMVNKFFDFVIQIFSETVSYDVSTFYQVFTKDSGGKNIFQTLYMDIIIPLSVSILILILVWNLYKSIFSKDWCDIEEPGALLVRSMAGLFIIWNCQSIMNLPVKMMQSFMDKVSKADLSTFSFSQWDMSSISVNDVTSAGIVVNILIEIIAVVIFGWTFIKLMYVYIQRYVAYCIYLFLAPLAFSAMGAKGTSEVTKRSIKLYAEVLLSLLLTMLWLKVYSSGMISCISNAPAMSSGIMVLTVFIVKAFGDFGIKLDDLLTKAGLLAVGNERAGIGMAGIMATRALGNMMGHSNRGGKSGSLGTTSPLVEKLNRQWEAGMESRKSEGGKETNPTSLGSKEEASPEEINNASNLLNDPNTKHNTEQNTSSLSKLLPNGEKQVQKDGKPISENTNGLKMMHPDSSGKVSPENMFKNPKSGQWEKLGTDERGQSYKSPVNLKDIKNGSVTMGNNAVRMGMSDDAMPSLKDDLNSSIMKNGFKSMHGVTNNKDGSSNLFEISPNDAGDFNVTSGDYSYSSLAEARDAVGAESISIGSSSNLDTSSADAINSGMKSAAGITEEGGIGITGAGAYKVLSMGDRQADGIYFDTNTGKMETFHAKALGKEEYKREAKGGNKDIIKLKNGQYMKFEKGTRNREMDKYARTATLDRDTGSISISNVSGLNKDGKPI